MAKRRNPVVRHATILRKGGAHTTSKSSHRRQQKQALNDELDFYFEQNKSNRPGADSDCPDSITIMLFPSGFLLSSNDEKVTGPIHHH